MKKVSLLILVSLILLMAFASCDKLPPLFGEEPEPEHVHDWMEATCEAPKTCACGATEGEKLPHTWAEATCSSPKVCTFCNKTEGSALNHKWVEADCETPATCSLCGVTSGEALGHVWISASCDSAKHCAACYLEEGEPLEHVWAEATCLTPKTCTLCQETDGPALGHTNETVPGYAATCKENGLTDGTVCTVCGETTLAQQIIPALGHTHSGWIVDLEPTCTTAGSQHKECTVCSAILNTESIAPLGHTETDWIEDKAATCDEKGAKHKECTVCGATTKTAAIPVLGHTEATPVKDKEVAPTCTTAGSYDEVVYCATCGDELARNTYSVPELGHTMSNATCQTPSTCSVCGHIEGTVVACKAGEEKKEKEVAPTCEATGSYDIATYCVWCNAELSRKSHTVDALGHNMAPATCQAPSTCLNGCGKTEGQPLEQHTVTASYIDEVLIYRCATCSEYFVADKALVYDGTKLPVLSKNGDPSITVTDGEYVVKAGTQKSQYMLYFPSNSGGHADIFKDFTGAKNSVGVISFKFKAGDVTDTIRFIVMTARDNPNWDANGGWNGNSMDLLQVKPNGDGTYTVNGMNITSNEFATVSGDEWVDVKMFMQLTSDGMFNISYYVNGVFCNVYSRDLLNAGDAQTIKDLMIQCIYVCGWTEAGTGWIFDDFAFGYTNDSEWVFDDHKHTWADANCTAPKTCTACGITEGEALGHELVDHAAQAPTCTEKGWEAYQTCNKCDYSTYKELAATGHNYGSATCDQAAACTVCGFTTGEALGHEFVDYQYNNDAKCELDGTKTAKCIRCDATDTKTAEGTALEHNWASANCASPSTCTLCGKTGGEPDKALHTDLTVTANGSLATYSCSACGYSFKTEVGDFMDGTHYNGMGVNASDNGKYYTSNPDKANYPVLNGGYYEYVRNDVEAGAQKQLQVWLPTPSAGTNKFSGFSAASNSTGYLSFSINAYTDHNLEMKLVDNRVDNLDLNGDGTAESIRWSDAWAINDPVFRILPPSNGKAQLVGFNSLLLATVDVDENNYTGWVDVAIQLVLDPVSDQVIATYYVNGAYAGTSARPLTTHTDAIQSVYINSNNKAAGTGYKIDNIAFGYTAHKHNLSSAIANGILTYSCECGASYRIEEFRDWDGDGSDSPLKNVPNGNVTLNVNDKGQYEYLFKPATDVAPDFSAAGTQQADGWYEYTDKGYAGGQLQMWMPSNNRGEGTFEDFSCENNAVGVISFNVKSSLTRHPDWDTALTFSIGKPRNAADWNDGGSWNDDSINVFTIEDTLADGATLKGGLNGTNINFGVIPAGEDGWTEWFNVMMVIEMTDDGYLTIYYYINSEFVGSDSRDLNNPGSNRTLNPKKIEALQISGWTYAANTGIIFDDFYFGYTVQGHNTLDGHVHNVTNGATCADKSTCSCGWEGYITAHDFTEATCGAPATCKGCGITKGEALTHNSLVAVYVDGNVQYTCKDCNKYYTLDGGMHDMGDISDATTAGLYNKTYDGKTLTMLNNGSDTNAQHQFWVPGQTVSPDLAGFTCANNATGFLSFTINSKDDHNTGIEFKVNANRNTSNWGGPTNNGWSESSVGVFKIMPHKDTDTTVKITGYNGATLGNWTMTGTDGWTGEMNVVIKIQLKSDNTVSLDYYINGEYFANVKADMVIWTYDISSLYVNGRTNSEGDGYILSNLYFGYTVSGLHDAPVVEEPFYTEEIAKESVSSSVLQTIVTNKIKQWDQSEAHNSHNGTPVFVKADMNGTEVTGVYFSKTTPWVGDEGEQFSEFRVNVDSSKLATGFSFSYKVKGTVDENKGSANGGYTFKDLEGNFFEADAYVQIKTPANHPLAGDNYPELSGTDFILDGEWHTMTYTFPEALAITNMLFNFYHFQGELIIADLEVNFYVEPEAPFYTEEIAKEDVSSSVLQTVVTNKIKQWDQSSAHNSHEGTPVFVKADMNGTEVTGVYFSKTTPWVGDEGEQFSEFRVNVDSSKPATGFSFVYKVEGTVDENKGSANGGYTFKDLEGNFFEADAYVQIKTPSDHPLAGDNYPELSGTDFILDGEWHTMTYTFPEALAITNMLFNFYHFQGELIIAELEVFFVEECQHTNTTTTKVDSTCLTAGSNKVVCNDCGETLVDEVLPVVAHNMLYKVEGEGVVVSCAYECGEGYSIDKGYYTPGTDASLLTPIATNYTAGFTSIANGRPDVSEDGYLVFARKEGYTGLGQVQLHYRDAAASACDTYFPDFSAAAGANGVLEFKINPNLDTTGNLRVIVSERVASGFGWNTHSITLLTFNPATADGKINVTGWGGNALATLEKGEDGYTGWIHVRITIELSVNEKGQNIGLVKYYFNGEHVGTTHSALNTLVNGRINNLYITSNHTEVGTGYMLDDLVFGYSTTVDDHEHSYTESVTAPTCTKAGFTTFTCDCGHSYTGNEVAALGHDEKTTTVDATCLTAGSKKVVCNTCGETLVDEVLPATGHTLSTVATDGKVSVVCAGCDRTYACDTSYVYDGANQTWNWGQGATSDISLNVVDGEYVISANSEIGSQYMLYIPSSNRNYAMGGFTGEANALGVVSFKVKTDAQNYYDENGKLVQPGTVRFILMEARNSNSNWVGWSDNSVDVLAIQPNNDGTYKVHGNSMTSTTLTTIAADEWLDVQMIVRITSAQTMTIDYYLNDTFCGSFTKDFNAENYGMRLVNNLIESLYICGWTQGQGTGVVFDDLYIGYTAFGHWTFDDNVEHVVTEATSCTAPATCTCGWVGDVLPHDMTEASCAAPATCKTCGFTTGEALKHNYTTLVNDGTVKYLCEDCMLCYSVETGTLSDGNNPSDNIWKNFTGAGGADFNGNGAYPALVEGADGNKYFQYLKAETTDAKQIQIWLPGSSGKGLQGFTADANNVGFFSLDFNANMDHNCEWKFVDFSSDAGRWTAEWNIDNPFFRMTTPSNGQVELRGFNGVAFATVDLDENNYTGWMNLAFMITLDAEQDLVIVDYYLNGQYKATMSAPLTTKTNGICAIYMNGNAKEAGTGYMVDNIAFGYGSFGTHEHTWTNATCTTAKTCSGCGMVEGTALGHDFDEANCTSPKTCAICDATEGEALGHNMQPATCTSASKCSRCSHTEGEALGHADENGDFKCDACSAQVLPADGEALTIPQALAIAKLQASGKYTTQKYYITGIVTNVYNTTYGNLYLKDADGNQICIYGLYTWDKAIRYDKMEYKPIEGDELTVYTVLGNYNNTTYQGKDAWIDEVVAHTHNYTATVTAPTCVASGFTTYTCSICSGSYQAEETEALGHTTDSGECERCGLTFGGSEPVIGDLAVFTFGANGSATHKDPNSKFSNGKSYTVSGYTLKFTSATNCYDGGNDAKGNSCMKMGTSSNTGSFTVTVADDVTEVIIYVAQYKANTTKISVNGGAAQTISTASNNGAYTAVVIDTSVNKTFTFATVSGGVRCMIDTIVFRGVVG